MGGSLQIADGEKKDAWSGNNGPSEQCGVASTADP